jgi:hypothetical protein
MTTYNDLKLKELREKCDIDFAHYTYKKGQCSCCYGPKDLAKTHWRKGIEVTEDLRDYSYILFKNADNGSGHVTKNDTLNDIEFIEWNLNNSQLHDVCKELSVQYGDGWAVLVPEDDMTTIIVMNRKYENFNHYFYPADTHGFEIFYENGNKFKKDK